MHSIKDTILIAGLFLMIWLINNRLVIRRKFFENPVGKPCRFYRTCDKLWHRGTVVNARNGVYEVKDRDGIHEVVVTGEIKPARFLCK